MEFAYVRDDQEHFFSSYFIMECLSDARAHLVAVATFFSCLPLAIAGGLEISHQYFANPGCYLPPPLNTAVSSRMAKYGKWLKYVDNIPGVSGFLCVRVPSSLVCRTLGRQSGASGVVNNYLPTLSLTL